MICGRWPRGRRLREGWRWKSPRKKFFSYLLLFGVDSVFLHERIKVAPLDVDLPPTLNVWDATVYDAIIVKCLRRDVKFLAHSSSVKVLLLHTTVLPLGLDWSEALIQLFVQNCPQFFRCKIADVHLLFLLFSTAKVSQFMENAKYFQIKFSLFISLYINILQVRSKVVL